MGVSILLIAAGAILKFAVTASVSGVSLATIGVILMVVGAIGLLVALIMGAAWGSRDTVVRDRYVDRDPVV
jgi:uncharacterized membrane protein